MTAITNKFSSALSAQCRRTKDAVLSSFSDFFLPRAYWPREDADMVWMACSSRILLIRKQVKSSWKSLQQRKVRLKEVSSTMPGVHSNVSEIMQLSRLSPEIPRIDILEHEHESQMGNTLFDMFGTQFSLSGASNASYNSSSSHDKSMFSEIAIFPEQNTATKVVHENGSQAVAAREQAGEHGFDSFQFLRRSMFDGKEKEILEDPRTRQASPSSGEIEAPIARLWTEYEPHCSDDGGSEQQHTSYEHQASISTEKSLDNSNNSNLRASLKANSSWGISRSSSGLEPPATKPKRKRSRPCKSSEEVESQRMTHIAVERNRRKQMNEHLRVLRSLMPGSYVQRGDQASIIGGAIEFVKELQQLLQCLEEQKKRKMAFSEASPLGGGRLLGPSTVMQAAAGFPHNGHRPTPLPPPDVKYFDGGMYEPLRELYGEAKSELADVEVKIVGMGAFIKILSQRKPGQLLKTMTALERKLFFTILHTNVTTIEQTVLYSFEVKVGPECTLAVDDIATFIHHTLATTHNGPEEL